MKIFDKVKEAVCKHRWTFIEKRPVGTQAIKFEWVYKCSKCPAELHADKPR